MNKCRICEQDCGDICYGITKSHEFVAVNEKSQAAYILQKDDSICDSCFKAVTLYRREKY